MSHEKLSWPRRSLPYQSFQKNLSVQSVTFAESIRRAGSLNLKVRLPVLAWFKWMSRRIVIDVAAITFSLVLQPELKLRYQSFRSTGREAGFVVGRFRNRDSVFPSALQKLLSFTVEG
jgi:hypothetical protein